MNNFSGNTASGNDCWGYTSPSGREYAIMGLEGGYGFVEITDPANPVILTTITGPSSLWHDVKVVGQYAYGVSEGGAGIQVMDLSNIDAGVVTLVRNWQAGGHSTTHNLIVDDDGTDLYLAGANIGNGGLMHLDMSDPTRPTVDGGWTNMYVHDAQVVTWQGGPLDGREIAFCAAGMNGGFTSAGLRVVDITDPANATTLATLFYPNAGYAHQVWLSSDRRYLYLNDELDEETGLVPITTTRVIDVSDPANPVLLGTFSSGRPSIDHNLYTRDEFIFQANYRSGLRVFNGSDPVNPIEIGYFDTFPNSDAAQFNGAWSVYPFFPSGTVIVSDIERGLFILDVTALDAERLIISPVGEVPTTLDPAGGAVMSVSINAFNTQLDASSVALSITDANGTRIVAGVDQGGGVFSFTFPSVACGGATFFVSADATNGQTFTLPADGSSYSASVVSSLVGVFADDFQTNRGWTVASTASDGQWQRGVPVNAGRGDPPADADGSGMCYVTDNSAANGGNSDVDNGSTTLTSPVLDLTRNVRISYAYWLN
ncbi:MAG TPA: choice-of-anchor B family protein, partial [Phycisphaerales bacterium]|nr:choice-of-anchor B family protein [Phycisphaerales bacterium]